ncbi:MAG TPA: phosphate ABC transporter substrate-binding protein PstS [Thermoplasmata archaeon]|jgi:phosphate ABC transporter phosphate-binding protein|nr:phosphate ABC transporter substrate-binding protein PstS [Thermoplasmata archaeon]
MSANNASGTNPNTNTTSSTSASDKSKLPKSSSSSSMAIIAVVVILVIVVAVVGYGAYAGWFTKKTAATSACPAGTGQTIAGAGSSLAAPLMTLWASQYSCGQLNYNSVGSGAGVTDLTQKTVDIGASDAPLSSTQVSALPSGSTVLTIPELVAGVAVIYNIAGISKGLNFTGGVLAGIYLGQITTWNNAAIASINPGAKLPSANITVVERADSSGTTYVYTSWLTLENSSWKSKVGAATSVTWPTGVKASGSLGVAGTVKSDPNSIGYVDLAYAITNGLSYGAIQNPGTTYVLPNETNTAAAAAQASAFPAANAEAGWDSVSILNEPGATTYPLATFSYVMVYSDLGAVYGSSESHSHAQGVVEFLWWAVTTGQNYSAGLSYVPLPSNVVASDEAAINSVLYNGQTLQSH